MATRNREETLTYNSVHGDLIITHMYTQILDENTGEPSHERRTNTILTADDWLTEEMVEQYKKWQESGFTEAIPSFLSLK